MKKNSLILVIVAFFAAQIPDLGVYGQLSGTLVIGPLPTDDYPTFTAAVSALHSQGINGNVIFEVKPGVYNEQISINQITGAGPTAAITFRAQNNDSTSVVLQYPSSASSGNNYVIRLNGADYCTFDKMTIKRTDTLKYCQVIEFYGNARKNTFSNCIFEGNANPVNTQLISTVVGSNNTGFKSYNVFLNNTIKNGSVGLSFTGQNSSNPDSCIQIRNNKFINQSLKGIHVFAHRFAYIDGNEVITSTVFNNYCGMFFQNANDTMRLLNNKISLSTGDGMSFNNCNETVSANILIANNFISIGGNSNAHGIYILNSKNLYMLHNSINIYNTVTIYGACIHINGSSTTNLNIKNNVLVNAGTGQGYVFYVSGTAVAPLAEVDYNALFINSGQWIGYWKTSGITTLANWRTASSGDAHSFTVNPGFVSNTDLHASSPLIAGAGTSLLNPFVISRDIDGDLRNTGTPDIGADELAGNDVGVGFIKIPATGNYCLNQPFYLEVFITNFGTIPFSGTIPLFYKIDALPLISDSLPNTFIAPGDSVLFTFTTPDILTISGNHKFLAGTAVDSDLVTANDTSSRMVMAVTLPDASFAYIINDLEVSFTNTSASGFTYHWDFGDGNTSSDENPVHTYANIGNYPVMLKTTNACGSDSITQYLALLGTAELAENAGISIYPNPVTDLLKVTLETGVFEMATIRVYSSTGILMYKIDVTKNQQIVIDMADMPGSIYLMVVQIDKKIFYKKVLKIK
ncbi:MAG TPA: PKD domain-containing protein [Bacteroidales bacterium]|nr:PKD domain-containing protein [Bacteroidales bacterium]